MIAINARFLTQSLTGVQRFAIEISLQLKKLLGNEVVFLSPHNIVQDHYANKLDAKIIGTHCGYTWEQLDLPLFLKRNNYPLLLNLANTAPIMYRNKISTIHDLAFLSYPQTFTKKFLYTYKLMIPLIAKSSRHIITVSEFSKNEIYKAYHIKKEHITVIYNAVNKEFFYKENKDIKSNNYFLAVSSLNYRKNFLAVLKAFTKYSQNHKNDNLYIIGDIKTSNFKEIDITKYKAHPHIHFWGRVSDKELQILYSNAIGFIFPSIYEGFGLPPLEAQACNCPILVSNIPPHKEIYEESAIYCNPYDTNDIATKMEKLKFQSKELIALGAENIKRFSFEKSAKKVFDILLRYNNRHT